ncbi:MAG TPA: T9SS type A sorting domain-containing protein [Paludibacteraceae bacterium]|nr:T9SS type A sorting domain-containing protein [Paludibacteraceae bacterium]HQF50906.1 T9SS type A sorting domain-containing protein [Paludibacteraceae bacterium]
MTFFLLRNLGLIVLEETTELKIANFETLTVTIVPNPSDGETNVYMRFFKKTNCHIFVLDQRGTLISEMTASLESGETMLPLRLENITSGVYILKIVIDEDVLVNELIVK